MKNIILMALMAATTDGCFDVYRWIKIAQVDFTTGVLVCVIISLFQVVISFIACTWVSWHILLELKEKTKK